jgi:amidase
MGVINDLEELDGLGIKELVDNKEVTTREVLEHCTTKIKQLNDSLNAVVYTMFDEALNQEKNKDFPDGPLSGIPTLIKELNDIAGHPATSGSKLLEDYVAKENDVVVERLKNAGVIFLGKTNSPEFGFLPTTEPELFGATKNPWNMELSPGGSSGGAACSVAVGMVPFAQGSDGGGSIRIPAALCGVFGLKPSRGRLPYSDYFNQLSTSHVLTRTVRDSAFLLDILKGGRANDPFPALANDDSYLHILDKEPESLKIAIIPDWNGQATIDEETRNAIHFSAKLLEALGHDVEMDCPNVNFDRYAQSFIHVWVGSGSVIVKHLAQMVGKIPSKDNLELLSYNLYKAGDQLTAMEYEEARILLLAEVRKILAFYDKYDVIVTPVLNKHKIPLGEIYKQEDPIGDMLDNMINYCSFPSFANVSGQPSMSMPLYWSNEGLPVGTMFTAAIGREDLLFQLAHQLEQVSPWFAHYMDLNKRLKVKTSL